MSFFSEFKEFISKGNVLDLAVGVIVGGAFSTITTSLTNDIIMPIVSIFLGGVDFTTMKITLPNLFGVVTEDPNTLNYGNFISAIINFLILAFVVFCIVKAVNKMRAAGEAKLKKQKEEEAAAEEAAPPAPSAEEALLTEIRDLLKGQKNG
jgi:large conductance mechanosensitive channel